MFTERGTCTSSVHEELTQLPLGWSYAQLVSDAEQESMTGKTATPVVLGLVANSCPQGKKPILGKEETIDGGGKPEQKKM